MTAIIVRVDPTQIRPTATANVACTLLLLSSVCGQYELERSAEATARSLSDEAGTRTSTEIALRQSRHRKLDRIHAEYHSYRWLVVDGLNLWPIVVFALVTAGLLWQGSTYKSFSPGFVPWALFLEATVLATLMANDVRAFLVSCELMIIAMTALIGRWGGTNRRTLASRFLLVQFSGHLFVAFGLAMTIVGVPWLKVDETTTTPVIMYKLSSISFEIQTWVTNNQLAFQYVQEVFPFVILTLCLGFAIQVGYFPFHSSMTSIVSQTPVQICLLYLTGFSAATYTSWYRLIFPIAPDVLVRFDRILLIASVGGAVWALVSWVQRTAFRDRVALAYFGLMSFSLLGPYGMSLVGLCGSWLLQQQAVVLVSLILAMSASPAFFLTKRNSTQTTSAAERRYVMQTCLISITLIGVFASGSGLVTELLRESLELTGFVVGLSGLILILALTLFARTDSSDDGAVGDLSTVSKLSNRIVVTMLLMIAMIINLAPQLLLMQCEPEFARVFRQFEKIAPASSARHHADLRQTPP